LIIIMSLRSVILSVLASFTLASNVHDRAFYESKFFDWMSIHNVKVASGERFVHMLENFANNEDIIQAHNSGNSTFKLGHNQFSAMTVQEWREAVHLGLGKPSSDDKATNIHQASNAALPASVDWTTVANVVTPVKDQGQCGSCWSFSTTGALEGAVGIKYPGQLPTTGYSEQQLVDCDYGILKNLGCNGGLMDKAFSWIQGQGGLCTEANYPYTSGTTKKNGSCQTCSKDAKSAVKSYTDVAASDAALMSALAQQPVSVAIEADQSTFQLYASGVLTAACGTNLDHGVLAVGYGTLNGQDYYKVKNSWGPSWGDAGFILLARGAGVQAGGQCGILNGPPSYPVL